DADLPAVHPKANRTGESGCAGDARQSLDPDFAVDPRGHHENPRQVVRLRHRHADDPRACHLPSGLSLALAVLQAHGVAGFARDREGAGAVSLVLRAGTGALILRSGLLAASRRMRHHRPHGLRRRKRLLTMRIATAFSAARWPSRSAIAAAGRLPSARTPAA